MSWQDKYDIRRKMIAEVDAKVIEQLDNADTSSIEARGAKSALREHVKNLLGIVAAVDDELGKSIPDLETMKLVKGWVTRCVHATENLAAHLENVELGMLGEIAANKATHEMLDKLTKIDDSRRASIEEAIKAGDVVMDKATGELMSKPGTRSLPGVRPGPSLKRQRQAEEKKTKKKTKKATKKTKKKTARKKAKK